MNKTERNKERFRVTMEAYKQLQSSGLLSSTDEGMILSRIKSKYKLSPYKYLRVVVIIMSMMLFVSCMSVPVYVAVNTKSGVCVVGKLVDEDEVKVVVEGDNGTEVTIQRKDISNMRELSNSSSDDDILWYLPLL